MAANGQRNDSYALRALNLASEHQRLKCKNSVKHAKRRKHSLNSHYRIVTGKNFILFMGIL